jgi:hypothetical protein
MSKTSFALSTYCLYVIGLSDRYAAELLYSAMVGIVNFGLGVVLGVTLAVGPIPGILGVVFLEIGLGVCVDFFITSSCPSSS